MNLRYFDIAWMSGHDGPGKRVVLYLQECHLRCEWCHSPHLWESGPFLLFFENRCIQCGRCAEICKQLVHKVNIKSHTLYRSLCVRCGDCILACPSSSKEYGSSALQLSGREKNVTELFSLMLPQLELLKEIGGLTL